MSYGSLKPAMQMRENFLAVLVHFISDPVFWIMQVYGLNYFIVLNSQ